MYNDVPDPPITNTPHVLVSENGTMKWVPIQTANIGGGLKSDASDKWKLVLIATS